MTRKEAESAFLYDTPVYYNGKECFITNFSYGSGFISLQVVCDIHDGNRLVYDVDINKLSHIIDKWVSITI